MSALSPFVTPDQFAALQKQVADLKKHIDAVSETVPPDYGIANGVQRGLLGPADYAKLSPATTLAPGIMSAVDKTKLNNLWTPDNASGATLVSNLNTITKTGFYNVNPSTSPGFPQVPGGGVAWYYVEHIEHINQNGYSVQIAYPLDVSGGFWAKRMRRSATWESWYFYGDVPWTAITLASSTYGPSFGPPGAGIEPPSYRVVGKLCQWRGTFLSAGSWNASGWGITGNIPAAIPANQLQFSGPIIPPIANAYVIVQASGQTLAVVGGANVTSGAGTSVSVTGLQYPVP